MVAIQKSVSRSSLCLEVGQQFMCFDIVGMATEIIFQERYGIDAKFDCRHRNHLYLKFRIVIMKGKCPRAMIGGARLPQLDGNAGATFGARLR